MDNLFVQYVNKIYDDQKIPFAVVDLQRASFFLLNITINNLIEWLMEQMQIPIYCKLHRAPIRYLPSVKIRYPFGKRV